MTTLTYVGSGVNYELMDPFKIACQKAAQETAAFRSDDQGFIELPFSRGESVYLMRLPDGRIMGHVEEGLGTKNLVADAVNKLLGRQYYDKIAQDTVAMMVNDMITLNVMPYTIAMHLAVGSSDWFKDEQRSQALIRGWQHACMMSGAVWAGGETPTLKDIVDPGTCVLSGSAVGYVDDESNLFSPEFIENGDAIVILQSSGIHANGLTLARKIASKHEHGYLARLSDGRYFGEALLDPTPIYVPVLAECDHLSINYAVNVTGHGWRKLMRAKQPFEYVIEKIPQPQPIFRFIGDCVNDEREMYGNYNMGAGFVLYVDKDHADEVVSIARREGFPAFRAGFVRKSDIRRVIIEERGIVFEEDELQVR